MMAVPPFTPSASQWASAAMHLSRRDEWRFVRIGGERYAVLPSGTSGKTYLARADAAGCQCRWYLETGRQCSHLLALELAATEDDLRAAPAEHQPTASPTSWRPCRRQCGALLPPESTLNYCDACWERAARLMEIETGMAPFALNPLAE